MQTFLAHKFPSMDNHVRQSCYMDNTTSKTMQQVVINVTKLMEQSTTLNRQIKLAKRSGVSQATISRVLRGETEFTIDQLEAIAAAFGIHPSELLADESGTARLRYDADAYAGLPEEEKGKIESYIRFVISEYNLRTLEPATGPDAWDVGITFQQIRELPEPLRSIMRRAAQRELNHESLSINETEKPTHRRRKSQ